MRPQGERGCCCCHRRRRSREPAQPSAAPCSPQPGSAAAPPRLSPPLSGSATVRAALGQTLPPPQCRGGGAPGPASYRSQPTAPPGTARLAVPESPAQPRPKAGRDGPKLLSQRGLRCRTVPSRLAK